MPVACRWRRRRLDTVLPPWGGRRRDRRDRFAAVALWANLGVVVCYVGRADRACGAPRLRESRWVARRFPRHAFEMHAVHEGEDVKIARVAHLVPAGEVEGVPQVHCRRDEVSTLITLGPAWAPLEAR